ncbi:hypothetical protein ACLQ24_30660, partial [Micromonospora sp. DT4]|uniref:hypothetical protein n=1 Tax=Micromonospora sp. DT4 TaxID=3393438 RepID=UPI003CF05B0D
MDLGCRLGAQRRLDTALHVTGQSRPRRWQGQHVRLGTVVDGVLAGASGPEDVVKAGEGVVVV